MNITLSEGERNVIKVWAESNIHGGHWGNGDVTIPEEGIILKKIDQLKGGRIDLNQNEARIILTWSESSFGIHTMEEQSVIQKLKKIMGEDT